MNYLYNQKNVDYWKQDMILYYNKIKIMQKYVSEKNGNMYIKILRRL